MREPDAHDLRAHRARTREYARERKQLNRLRREPSRTLDGVDIKLWANAESREDVAEAHALGAAGIGLYRTEFLFLNSTVLPDEEAQFRAYRDLVLGMTGRTVTIRTLDMGADKADRTGLALVDEPNPALGVRGVRLSLLREGLFETQLRAMVRASGYGPVRILVPMVCCREEMVAARALLKRVIADLRREGHEIAEQVPLGAMIEVPSAAIALPGFIGLTDFLSIGTNDLVQYLLAVDRNNESLGDLYTPLHPAVVRLLHSVIALADKRGKPIAVCGEMAADPTFVPILLALGLGNSACIRQRCWKCVAPFAGATWAACGRGFRRCCGPATGPPWPHVARERRRQRRLRSRRRPAKTAARRPRDQRQAGRGLGPASFCSARMHEFPTREAASTSPESRSTR